MSKPTAASWTNKPLMALLKPPWVLRNWTCLHISSLGSEATNEAWPCGDFPCFSLHRALHTHEVGLSNGDLFIRSWTFRRTCKTTSSSMPVATSKTWSISTVPCKMCTSALNSAPIVDAEAATCAGWAASTPPQFLPLCAAWPFCSFTSAAQTQDVGSRSCACLSMHFLRTPCTICGSMPVASSAMGCNWTEPRKPPSPLSQATVAVNSSTCSTTAAAPSQFFPL
mmetsp:Transcript_82852/g.268439  ORF Transcript_82852/g.268439 Transcript_82852/m.268439 type:complete len:225 (-) Transcript_82852:812-1486(-)